MARVLCSMGLGLALLCLAGCRKDAAKHGDTQAAQAAEPPTSAKSATNTQGKNASSTGLSLVKGAGDLGAADYGEKRSTTFTVKNNSGKAITLEVLEKSCACAGIEIRPTEVPAGGSAEVTLNWVPKLDQVESVNESVLVRATIAPRGDAKAALKLEARGRVTPALHVQLPRGRLDFEAFDLGQLKAGKKESAVVVYTKDDKHKGFSLTVLTTPPGIKLTPPEPQRLPAPELMRLGAVDGYRLNIRCVEGLPVGTFRELIRLKSSTYENQVLEIAVTGYLETGAVSVKPDGAVRLPETIDLSSGYKCLPLTVTLSFEANRTLSFEKADPPLLQVTVTKMQENTWKIEVHIPAGEAAVRRLLKPEEAEEFLLAGWEVGVLTFKTDHPLAPVLKIPVDGSHFRR